MIRRNLKGILIWMALNIAIAAFFGYALLTPAASSVKASFLPGETTHGHYQIELNCNACHSVADDPKTGAAQSTAANVMTNACNRCHAEQLEMVGDTHPASKFNDPANAETLAILDAQNCLACHQEHMPERTLAMGLTIPGDYCWHCHDTIGEDRPSHQEMAFDSCATAGCHNYHDNRALFEKHLNEHFGEEDYFETAVVPTRNFGAHWQAAHPELTKLSVADASLPTGRTFDDGLMKDWAETAHAAAGVNCDSCHAAGETVTSNANWIDGVAMETCGDCHQSQVETFVTGKHGMRLGQEMTPMTPGMARLPMHAGAEHSELTCNACHSGHRFDTQYAAVDACVKCHADAHSTAYLDSSHAQLWRDELHRKLPTGSGVSCATCHLPRLVEDERSGDGEENAGDGDAQGRVSPLVTINHDQNAGLRPNETMARQVCAHCHGLEFSLSALTDPELIQNCFQSEPEERIESVQMAHDWFAEQERKREARKRKREQRN